MKTILVPTDFSQMANNSVLYALKIAKKNKAQLLLLHTYELSILSLQPFPFDASNLYKTIDLDEFEGFKDNLKVLRKIAEENNVEDVPLFHKLSMGDLNYNINETVKKENVDMIVVATSGGQDFFSKLVGSNTDSVIISSKVPVIVLPKDFDVNDPVETIGFTTRFREKDKKALQSTIEFAESLGLRIKCMHAQTETDFDHQIVSQWENEFKNHEVSFFVYPSDDVFETIEEFITHQEIDMLAMVTYKRDFLEELFTTRFTQKVTHKVAIPVLVLQ